MSSVIQMRKDTDDANLVHVAMMFDDGPFPEHAPKLVVLFANEGIAGSQRELADKAVRAPLIAALPFVAGNPQKITDFSCNFRAFLPK